MKKSVSTQREIAETAGVSRSTVTRALRNDPQISRSERERIQMIAMEMGYRPNPMINALMEQVRTGREARFQSMLAWVEIGIERNTWMPSKLFASAQARSQELGYDLEAFFPENGRTESFLRMLRARGIRGLLIAKSELILPLEGWDLSGFSAVTVGFRLGSPALHFVMNDWFAGGALLNRLWVEGVRRPALALHTAETGHKQFRIIGGYEAFLLEKVAAKNRIAPWRGETRHEKQFATWIGSAQPDALIVEDEDFFRNWQRPASLPVYALQSEGGIPGMRLEDADLAACRT